MVILCDKTYSQQNNEKYGCYFENYSFPLSNFQKYSIEAIVEGHHVLVNVPTGSGKTLSGEFAIEYFTKLGKKVIYTCPIKALSNQKYHDFTLKYPELSIGILTGDIKDNPNADILIMTAEILKNKLSQVNPNTDFDIDIQNDLGCVVMDEVHFINDKERGKVWEETIILLPKHVQIVMLSATLDNPEAFAKWVEHKGDFNITPQKQVYLTPQVERIVPLKHHLFFTCSNDIIKQAKDKILEKKIKDVNNKLILLKDENNKFNLDNYKSVYDLYPIFSKKRVFTRRSFVINQVVKVLKEKELLPALCFVLSKKNIEIVANEVTIPLLDFDTKIANISKECGYIIRKLPNYKEIMELPEYINMVKLLEKGIAIHHAGVLPILREMVEILFAKGFIKLLFATETFAVGINMPTKAVIFTSLSKFDGNHNRLFHSHEYTQMAGRAGRRGIDKEGHVILLSNLFPEESSINISKMIKGDPERLQSKFNISYSLILESLQNPNYTMDTIIDNSMINIELNKSINDVSNTIKNIEKSQEEVYKYISNNFENVKLYYELNEELPFTKNSRKKAILKQITSLKNENSEIDMSLEKYRKYISFTIDKKTRIEEQEFYEQFLNNTKQIITDILVETGYLNNEFQLTNLGTSAVQIKEMDSMIGALLIENPDFNELSSRELVCLLSCFIHIPTNEENRTKIIDDSHSNLKRILNDCENFINKRTDIENKLKINVDQNIKINYDLIDYCWDWCDALDVQSCNNIINSIKNEKQIFLGDFCKILIKISNISKELGQVCENNSKIKLLNNISLIPELILKHVISNQSLYI